MTTVDENVYSQLGLTNQQTQNTGGKKELGQEDFLALLTTQLANQDPFDPLDNKEFIAQMAQFSSLSSLEDLSTSFESLSTSLTSNQALQASALVGREVLIPADRGLLGETGSIEGQVELQSATRDIWVEVKDQSGQVVRRMNVGSYSEGTLPIQWDGYNENGDRMPPGVYQINVYGRTGDTNEQLSTQIRANVDSVSFSNNSSQILLNLGELGQVYLQDVREIG